MREIRFRGKTLDGLKWVYGDLIQENSGRVVIRTNLKTWGKNSDVAPYGESVDVKPDTVGQYTGLNDRNGKEVYENDILRVYDRKTYFNIIVSWSKEAVAFMACYCDKNQSPLSWFSNLLPNGYEIEVLGNIHDNPELLEYEG